MFSDRDSNKARPARLNQREDDPAIARLEELGTQEQSYSIEDLEELTAILKDLAERDASGADGSVSMEMSITTAREIVRQTLGGCVQAVEVLDCSDGYVLQGRTSGRLLNIRQSAPETDAWRYDSVRQGRIEGRLREVLEVVRRDALNW